MSYINREEAIRLIDEYQGGAMDKPTAKKILAEMEEAEPPTKCVATIRFDEDKMKEIVDDAIIRCKDCKHYVPEDYNCLQMDTGGWMYYPDDFCSLAERRTDG